MMDRLQAMTVFVAVAEEAGFALAARRLGLSPPSVTRAVSTLEGRLNARLFHRTTRSVQLTSAGERYLLDCRRILQEVEDADSAAAGVHGRLQGKVTVTSSVLFGRLVLAPVILEFLRQHPFLSVTTLQIDRVVNLMEEDIDVAVRIAELPDSSLSARRVGAVGRVLCASPDYLSRRGRPAGPGDLSAHDTIGFASAAPLSEWDFHHQGKRRIFRPRARLQVNNADMAIAAAADGFGIARVLSYMIESQVRSGALEIILQDHAPPLAPVHVVHKETGQTSARVRAVFDFLAERLKDHPALQQAVRSSR